jgi:hypothetical protein
VSFLEKNHKKRSSNAKVFLGVTIAESSNILYYLQLPESPRCQRQAVPADGGVFAWCVHRAPDGTAVALGHAVAKFRNPKRIPRRAKAPQHVAVLVASLDIE